MSDKKTYIAIDLKSFYASCECIERGLDPLKYNLLVADNSRTDKTICLAVSPPLKSLGVPGRPRLFEAIQIIRDLNIDRLERSGLKDFEYMSYNIDEINKSPKVGVDYIVAPPHMAKYIEISKSIYKIYLSWISAEDIHVYSIDEVFIDATNYLKLYGMDGEDLASHIVNDVLKETGITATAGVGTNMYLCKVAMDILAKHTKPNSHGVRVKVLDVDSYRKYLWDHRPLTDFWRVGSGYQKRLAKYGLFTMGDIAEFSIDYEDVLYKEFGINAELLIDHAWGYEPCTISDVKKYRPQNTSRSSGQVLHEPYKYDQAKIVIGEMADSLALDLYSKGLVSNQIDITIGYDRSSLEDKEINYNGEIKMDHYGRKIPKKSHGVRNLNMYTSSSKVFIDSAKELFDRIVNKELYIRKLNIVANNTCYKDELEKTTHGRQMDIFNLENRAIEGSTVNKLNIDKEEKVQKAVIEIKNKYGKNSILKGLNFREGATGIERNRQIGGHKSWILSMRI